MTDALITPAMRASVGVSGEQRTAHIERGAIRRFAEAIGDSSPRYWDESPIAPPTFLRSVGVAIPPLPDAARVPRILDGGSTWSYTRQIRAGDVITCTTRLESLTERTGRSGPMLIAEYITEYVDQHGQAAATQRNTIIRMGIPTATGPSAQ